MCTKGICRQVLINTLDRHLSRYSIDVLINTWWTHRWGNSAVKCWSILAVLLCTNGIHDWVLIGTLDWGSTFRLPLINISIITQCSINTSVCSQWRASQQIFADTTLSVDLYVSLNQLTLCQLLTNSQLIVDRVLIEILIKCLLSIEMLSVDRDVNQGLTKGYQTTLHCGCL